MKKTVFFILLFFPFIACWGQRVSIFGDSYSTFQGYIPDCNEVWYTLPVDTTRTDVSRVEETWWWQLIEKMGYTLEKNDSYSGSTVSFRGYDGRDFSDRSFITRLPRVGHPEILLIFGCINDSWAGVEVGSYKYVHIQKKDLYTYRPALAWLLSYTRLLYPDTEVYYIIGDGLRHDITESTKAICDHFGIPYIQLQGIDKRAGHPTVLGMRQIADQVSAFLRTVR